MLRIQFELQCELNLRHDVHWDTMKANFVYRVAPDWHFDSSRTGLTLRQSVCVRFRLFLFLMLVWLLRFCCLLYLLCSFVVSSLYVLCCFFVLYCSVFLILFIIMVFKKMTYQFITMTYDLYIFELFIYELLFWYNCKKKQHETSKTNTDNNTKQNELTRSTSADIHCNFVNDFEAVGVIARISESSVDLAKAVLVLDQQR